jgi:CBS domain-containing protein
MSRDIMVVRDSMPLRRLIELLAMPRTKQLPVVRDDRLVGIVSRVDLLRVLARA